MLRWIRCRLTYANVMSTVGVLIALGGVSYFGTQSVIHDPQNNETPDEHGGFSQYRHGDSNPGFRRERAAS